MSNRHNASLLLLFFRRGLEAAEPGKKSAGDFAPEASKTYSFLDQDLRPSAPSGADEIAHPGERLLVLEMAFRATSHLLRVTISGAYDLAFALESRAAALSNAL